MAFEGDLSHLALGDVLQTLAMSRQHGTFVIRGAVEERRLAFGPKGAGLLTIRQSLRDRVGEYLRGKGKVTAEAFAEAQRALRRRKDAGIEDLLFEQGAITEKDVNDARRYVAAEDVYELFLWSSGTFEFLSNDTGEEPTPYGGIWFDIASIAMEAARRMDEVGRLRETCPESGVFLGGDEPPADLGPDSARVLALADGRRTVDGILAASHLGRFDTWKALDTLRERGLVRLAGQAEVAAAAAELSGARDFAAAAPLLRALIVVDPEDRTARANLVQALISAGDKRGAATESVELGRRAAAALDAEEAIRAFQQAVRLDKDNAAAQDGLARALFDSGDAERGAEAARAAASLHVAAKDFASAVAISARAVECCPGDAAVRGAAANACIAAGEPAQALLLLDEAASLLETSDGDQRRLIDLYRRILQLDPSRKDCARRVEELESRERYRRRVLAQRLAIAAGVVLAALLAIPALRGPSVIAQIDAIREVANSSPEEAERQIATIDEESLNEDEVIALESLRARIAELRQNDGAKQAWSSVSEAVEALTAAAEDAQSKDWAACLAAFGRALDVFDGAHAAKLSTTSAARLGQLRQSVADDVAAALQALYLEAAASAATVAGAREKFTADVFQREDPAVLESLVTRAAEVARIRDSQNWAETLKGAEALRSRVKVVNDPGMKIRESIQSMLAAQDGFARVESEGVRALALLRKGRILEARPKVHGRGQALLDAGKVEEAREVYSTFLALCDELRRAEPRETYEPLVKTYLEGFDIESQPRERVRLIDSILQSERRAEDLLTRGDTDGAFKIRRELVLANRFVGFGSRFSLPVRIESSPAGATVTLFDGKDPKGRVLGVTPIPTFLYPVDEHETRLVIQLDGFEDRPVVLRGALDDVAGLVSVEMPKRADWSVQGVGKVEAGAAAVGERILVAGRDGLVRLISALDGSSAAEPFRSGSLAGCAGTPAVAGRSVLVAMVEGDGYVLDGATLAREKSFRFDGQVRTSLVSTPRGVVVATDSGTMTLYAPGDFAVRWTAQTGRVLGDPCLAGDRVVFVTADGFLAMLDLALGKVTTRVQLPDESRWSAPFAVGDRAWIAGDSGQVVCVDLAAAKVLWRQPTEAPVRTRPTLADGRLLVVTSPGDLLSMDPASGRILKRDLLGAPVRHPVLALEAGWVATTEKGMVLRYDATGTLVWRFDAHDELTAPASWAGGHVLVVTRKGTLHALRP